jgi:threonylcarbamoyladenosine tRNA methylthiotransferase MtaB
MKKTIAAITFGCKVNQYETSCILDEFVQHGFQIVEFNQPADVYIINSCTVTNRTDSKSRNAVRKALQQKKKNSNAKVVITGCYSQRNKAAIQELGTVDLIVDNNKKSKICQYIESSNLTSSDKLEDLADKTEFDELFTTQMIDHSRAFIKVQDGCDYYCAYCAIPYARGTSRSRKPENVLKQIKTLVDQGYNEFVLGGINLGLYGKENDEGYFLAHLLKDIEKINGVNLIRLSSIEPQLFPEDLLEYFRTSTKICSHFHIPLQVGCDELLKSMGRKYSTTEFVETIQNLKNIFPDSAIGIDVITGLPGETEELFQKTFNFLTNLDFTYLHVFPYSRRPGTKAAKLPDQVNGAISKSRSKILNELSQQKTEKYIDKILKQHLTLSGIIEKKHSRYWTALSDHFIRVYLKSDEQLKKKYLHFLPTSKRFDGVEVEQIFIK